MAEIRLYIDATDNQLIAGLNSATPVPASSLPFFYGDTLPLRVYLFNKLPDALPSDFPFEIIPTNGLSFFVYLDDGKPSPTIYTQQITWATDPNNQYWYANLALNTAALATLIGTSTSASCWLKIGYVQDGLQTTVYSQQVTIGVGIPVASLTTPPGLTALSVEVANATYVPLQPVAGQAIWLMSPLGKKIALMAVDDADGGWHFESNNVA